MYLDTRGLVTTGIGNLIDPVRLALGLPFQFKSTNRHGIVSGRMATRDEIESEWKYLKDHPNRASFIRLGARTIEPHTSLELSAANRQTLFLNKSNSNERQLRTHFSEYDSWPADAQLALMAMAWGLGPGFPNTWPNFAKACRARDFDAAAANSHIRSWRSERNVASVQLFSNAACVLRNPKEYSLDVLYYPILVLDALAISV
ncbi:MAG TPA: hypothetical protein VI299_15615 [Polyangiales bacterium]